MSTAPKPAGRWIPGGNTDAMQRSLKWFRGQKFIAEVTERWIPFIDRKPDLAAQNLAERLEAEMDGRIGDARPWSELAGAAAEKLRELAAGPFMPGGGARKDLFGFIDIEAITDDRTVAVQATSRAEMTNHLRKYRRDEEVRINILKWLAMPGREFVILGWGRREIPNKSGPGTHKRWCCEEKWVTATDMEEKAF